MKVIKTSLKNIVTDRKIYNSINELVIRSNKTVILTYQFFKCYFIYCFENNINTPIINDQLIKTIMKIVSISKNKRGRKCTKNNDLMEQLNKFNNEHFNDLTVEYSKQDYTNMSNIYKYLAIEMVTNITNNIKLQFIKHMDKYINFVFSLKIKNNDAFNNLESKEKGYLVRSIRRYLINNEIMEYSDKYSKSLVDNINVFIGKKEDTLKTFNNIYTLNEISNQKNIINDLYSKPEKYLKIMFKFTKEQEMFFGDNNEYSLLRVFPLRNNIVPKYIKIDKEVIKETLIRPKLWKLYDTDRIWKEHFNGLFNNKKNKKIIKKKDYVFNEMISTDGYAVSVILRHITEKKGFCKNKKKKMKSFNDFPYINELNDDKLEELKKSTLVGIDPGVNNILTCVDNNKNVLKYTKCQRQVECGYKNKTKVFKKEKEQLNEIEGKLSDYNSKTVDFNKFKNFIKTKNKINSDLFINYEKIIWRKYNWKTFISKQKSEIKLVNNIKNKFESKDSKICLLYGNWNRQSCMKYSKPTPKIGIKRLLKRHFDLYNIDEYNTSKKCHFCDSNMEKFMKRRKLNTKTNKEEERMVHGLLRCKNVTCNELCKGKNRIMNRDIGGALNIHEIGEEYIMYKTRPQKFKRLTKH